MLSDGVILLNDNTHTALKTQELLRNIKWEVWIHLPYSPDSAPNLGSKHLSRTRFSSVSDVKTVAENWLNGQDVISAKPGSTRQKRNPAPEAPQLAESAPAVTFEEGHAPALLPCVKTPTPGTFTPPLPTCRCDSE
ncbi:hypothetical protein AVEN_149212-1 [Araneus ventricosus]|uniref:Tc1-like transposase DDE domain-containing protein n=1 Tax=Araneus ventricosus TaxID=182803 RepID=A0A4Y2SY58_ARAVE|nr:hypothetical protein AVEN_63127-1 [Araneus ventricosus]GBN93197.1 hypothetical protein AVEN_149212-1 [Araneus ventricosus]